MKLIKYFRELIRKIKEYFSPIDYEFKRILEEHGYDVDSEYYSECLTPYKKLRPAFIGISMHDNRLCYDADKLPKNTDKFPLENYHIINVGVSIDDCDDVVILSEDERGLYKDYGAIIGVTDGNRVAYDYDKMAEALMFDYAKSEGKDPDSLTDDEQSEYHTQAIEWIDYNTIRSLGYDLMNGKSMPIVVTTLEDF
jgi:hypothetical protein